MIERKNKVKTKNNILTYFHYMFSDIKASQTDYKLSV